MTVSLEVQDVIDTLKSVSSLLRVHGGDWGEEVALRVDRYGADLAEGDVETLKSVLADTSGGNGSIRDVGLVPDGGRSAPTEDWKALSDRMLVVTAAAAEACRIAMRRHGLEVWR